jgi:hypothetical protein
MFGTAVGFVPNLFQWICPVQLLARGGGQLCSDADLCGTTPIEFCEPLSR